MNTFIQEHKDDILSAIGISLGTPAIFALNTHGWKFFTAVACILVAIFLAWEVRVKYISAGEAAQTRHVEIERLDPSVQPAPADN